MATLADLRKRFPFLRDIPVVNDEGDPLKGELFPIPFMVFASQAGGSLKNGEVEAYMLPGLQGDFNICEFIPTYIMYLKQNVRLQIWFAGTFGFISSGILTEM